ncbi:MAG: hypothetical protein DSY50_06680 [Desulfobulbus sp.]|nr:MAG: hypothetical protein DSY50_06680 [Desulfobulbus sp.]
MSDPVLYVFFGLIASGKSTLSALFCRKYNCSGYNTDRVRKELAGLAANERRLDGMGEGIYTPEFTAKTYQAMLDRTADDIAQGKQKVVLDGSYSRRADRRKVLELAELLGVRVCFILCTCSDQEVKRRLALRARDPDAVSDGRWEIFARQKKTFEFPEELDKKQFMELDTENTPALLLEDVERFCLTGLDNPDRAR